MTPAGTEQPPNFLGPGDEVGSVLASDSQNLSRGFPVSWRSYQFDQWRFTANSGRSRT